MSRVILMSSMTRVFLVRFMGAMLLLMGVLHGLNVLSLPVIGRLFTINRRLDDEGRHIEAA